MAVDFDDYSGITTDDIDINSLVSNMSFGTPNNLTSFTIKSFKKITSSDAEYNPSYQRFLFQITVSSIDVGAIITLNITGINGVKDVNNNYLQSGTAIYMTLNFF